VIATDGPATVRLKREAVSTLPMAAPLRATAGVSRTFPFPCKKVGALESFVALNDAAGRFEGLIGPQNPTIVSVLDRFIPGNRMFSPGIYIA
jgi:hypothetical protein